jgi:hypothetical protein
MDNEELEELKRIRDGTGLSLSRLIELKKKGYSIVKIKD